MKKNKAMRLASVLLVLTLLTTCMTAGTFAKYTTGAEGTSTARVAKFGVNVSVDAGNVFGQKYKNETNGNGVTVEENAITVKADEMVVAPGTKGEMTFSITGTPETSVSLNVVLSEIKEIGLEAGKYSYEDVSPARSVTVAAGGYDPVQWTLKKNHTVVSHSSEKLENTTLVKIKQYLEDNVNGLSKTEYTTDAFSNAVGDYTLSWEWKFTDDSNDDKDTLLGDLGTDTYTIKKDNQDINEKKLKESFKLTISVTQVD